MPVKVALKSVTDGLKLARKAEIFPAYNGNDSDYIKIDPGDGVCNQVVTVAYDTNFVISASDASTLTELIALARGVIPLLTGTPSIDTIINGVAVANAGINSAVDSEKSNGSQEFKLSATPCPAAEPAQPETEGRRRGTQAETPVAAEECYKVTLIVIGTVLMTDADPSDKEEQVHLSLTLSARNATRTATRKHPKNTNAPIPFVESLSIGPIKASKTFDVYAKLDEYCETDGPGTIGGDSVSLIKVDLVKIVLETVACPK